MVKRLDGTDFGSALHWSLTCGLNRADWGACLHADYLVEGPARSDRSHGVQRQLCSASVTYPRLQTVRIPHR